MRCSRCVAISSLFLIAFLTGCAVRTESTLMGDPGKLTLGEVQTLLQQSKEPVERTRIYVQLSDILIRQFHSSTGSGTDRTPDWLEQYEGAILSARETIMNSGRNAQRDPEGFKELEIALRRHIRWLNDWRIGLRDQERLEIDDTIETATTIRGQMLALLFPVAIPNSN